MLKKLRKQRNLQLLIFSGLSALFVLWGVGGTLGTHQRALMAGAIFGRQVTARDFLDQQQAVERSLRWTMNGAALPPEQVAMQTWIRLILLHEAHHRRLQVSDAEVVQTLNRFPVFSHEGSFDAERYQQFLKFQRLLPRQFEEEIRQALLIDRLREHVLREAPVDEVAARQAYQQAHQRFHVRYVPIAFKRFASEPQAQSLAFAVATQQQLQTTPPAQIERLLRQKKLKMKEPPPFTAQDSLDDASVSAAALAEAARKLSPGQWSEPVAGNERWLLVQLVQIEPPNDAQWATDREAFLKERRGDVEQGVWQAFITDAMQRAKLTSYLREPASVPEAKK